MLKRFVIGYEEGKVGFDGYSCFGRVWEIESLAW